MKKICPLCNNEFESKTKSICCCREHNVIYKNRLAYPDGTNYIECKLCGWRATNLNHHIRIHHKISAADYCARFGLSNFDIITEENRRLNSERQKLAVKEGRNHGWNNSGLNPSHTEAAKNGNYSPFSMNFKGYAGLSESEKIEKIKKLKASCVEKKKNNHSNPLSIDYYLSRGYSHDEAKQKIKERQTTFSLEKCIERHGEEKGKQIWKDRQIKWQNTLNEFPEEEKTRINKLKARSVVNIHSYSKISQKLFDEIYEMIKQDYSEIYYATSKHNNTMTCNSNSNHEYEVLLEDKIHRFFLDFYIKDNNKVIEFDGDYWHGEKRGNQERDRIREKKLNELGFVNIFHVRERDFNKDPEKVVKECIKFIRG